MLKRSRRGASRSSGFKRNNEHGAWIVNNGYTRAMAIDAVAGGVADMVAFGKLFISNPDLVNRLRLDAVLAAVNSETFYGGDARGYTDYPSLDPSQPAEAPNEAAPRTVVVISRAGGGSNWRG